MSCSKLTSMFRSPVSTTCPASGSGPGAALGSPWKGASSACAPRAALWMWFSSAMHLCHTPSNSLTWASRAGRDRDDRTGTISLCVRRNWPGPAAPGFFDLALSRATRAAASWSTVRSRVRRVCSMRASIRSALRAVDPRAVLRA